MLCSWDPHHHPILSEVGGVVRYEDVLESKTFKYERDPDSDVARKMIIEHKGDLHPQVIIETESGSVTMSDGEVVDFEIGTLYVPENRDDPDSRVIGVGFSWFPSSDPDSDAPPTFHLPGGPGSSYVSPFEDSSDTQRARFIDRIAPYRAIGDVIFVDQRGFSERGDVLRARFPAITRDPNKAPDLDDQLAMWTEFAESTRDRYADTEIDLRGYTVKECADDVADLANALGFVEFSLVGTSFGSQWSFAVMRRHPELIARALLSGVEPLDHAYDMPSYVFAAMQRMWWTLEQDEMWQPYLPEGGIGAAAEAVIARLERGEVALEIGDETVKVGPSDFPARDPAAILALYHGQYEGLAPQLAGSMRRPARDDFAILGVLIDSSLGATPMRSHRLWTDPATRYLGRDNFAGYMATDEIWPSPDVGDDFRTPVLCDIPVVFAQGDWDLSTPVENLYEIAPYFPNSRCIIAGQGGHGVIEPIQRELPEVWETMAEFLRSGDMEAIPGRVRLKGQRFDRPTFDLE